MVEEQRQAQRDPASDVMLPASIEAALTTFIEGLSRDLKDGLIAALLYGSAARGDYSPAHSDINIMLVLDEVSAARCDQIALRLNQAQRSATFELFLVTPQELERSADVFPLKFLDIQRHHRVLHGQDPLAKVEIAWGHLRLRVEQQIKTLMFELRVKYMQLSKRPEQLYRVMASTVGDFLISVGALLYLRDPQWWVTGKEHIAEQAKAQLGFDGPLIDRLLSIHRGQVKLSAEQVRDLYDHFMALVDQAAQQVDTLELELAPKVDLSLGDDARMEVA